jgi:hypothetical protein
MALSKCHSVLTPIASLIAPYLRSLLYDLDRIAGTGDKVKRGLASEGASVF